MTGHEQVQAYPFLNQLSHEDLVAILPYIDESVYPSGAILLARGEISSRVHMILSGTVEAHQEREQAVSLAKMGRGRLFGEWSCLAGEAVQAEYRADQDVRTLSLSRAGVLKLMDRCPEFQRQILESMIRRLRETEDGAPDEPTAAPSAALRQLDEARELRMGPLVGSSPFIQGLRLQLDILAAGDEPICLLGEKGVGKFHIASAIHYRSGRSLQPILGIDAAGYEPAEWNAKVRTAEGGTLIVEQADLFPADLLHRLLQSAGQTRIILTAETTPEVPIRCMEVAPLRERREDIPELVYAWLRNAGIPDPENSITGEALHMLSLHPYHGDNIDGLQRIVKNALARSDGKQIRSLHLRFDRIREPGIRPTIGLALGSGSVRGAAHVGVMKVLEAEHIPIDLVAGSSVGAFIGALYVGGQPISAFERVLPTVRWRQLVELAMPPKALADNRRMVRFLDSFIGPVHFEDLPIPFAVTAADAATGEGFILHKGRVGDAICASTAIPGIMKPVPYQDRLLIDGGVVHPVPVQLAKSMGADLVIAVDLSTSSYAKRFPKNFISSILNTIDIMSDNILREELQLADFVVNPQLDIQDSTFKSSSLYIGQGVRVTRDVVTSIKRKIHTSTAAIQ